MRKIKKFFLRIKAYSVVLFKKITFQYSFGSVFIAPENITIGKGVKIVGNSVFNAKSGKISIGSGTYVDRNVIFSCNGGNITVGKNCSFNPNSVIYGHGGLNIGDYVRVAAGVVIIPANHGYSVRDVRICDQPITAEGIRIEDDCWVGANVTVLDGVVICRGSVIGAGSVVTKSVESYSVAAGIPAKVIKKRI